jgi:hypothetical protein
MFSGVEVGAAGSFWKVKYQNQGLFCRGPLSVQYYSICWHEEAALCFG